jgi:RimJ/RimL family protein N-acetyltransferase
MSKRVDGPLTLTDKGAQPFTIRPYATADRASLGRMYDDFEPKRCAQGLPPLDAGQRTRWLDSVLASGCHVVVEVGDAIMGHGMLIPMDDETAELANFLHQEVRNRGIGTELNRALLDVGREHGIGRVWLSVEPTNRRAIRSYEKVGFRRRPTTGWNPEVEMEVHLTPRG